MVKVHVKPQDITLEVERGTIISEALETAGVKILLPCGGQGRCGRCKVVVEKGEVRRRSVARLSPAELKQGYALACQTLIENETVVFVPPQEELIKHRLPTEKVAERIALPFPCDTVSNPYIKAFYLEITPPSLADNTTDFERLRRELALRYHLHDLIVDLPALKKLARTLREADWKVTAIVEMHNWARKSPPRLIDVKPGNTTGRLYGIAVDIGTTSVVVYLVDLNTAQVVDTAAEYNKQIACGEDVISRIIYARKPGGLEHLQRLVVQTINELIAQVCQRQGINPDEIYMMTAAGNTTMIHLFLGLWPEPIRLEPYIPTLRHPFPVKAAEIGVDINPEATVDCLPGVGSYVGADITAGVLSSGIFSTDKLTLFLDIGTNGEMVLGNFDWLISCACSAGPAFEGAGVESGMRATAGAIEEVWINTRNYEATWRTIGDLPPEGLCGSGIISLLAEMFITGVMDKSGRINLSLPTRRVRVGPHGPEYVVAWKEETRHGEKDIVITEVDISNLLRAKAAIYAGLRTLARAVGVQIADVEQVLIGGAFGKYLNVEKAIQIGMFPDMPWDRFKFLGNTSALGAYICLVCPDMREKVVEIAEKMTYLELSADNTFTDEFTSALFFPHTDLEAFPSVKKLLKSSGIP
ncbi:MAG: ASKHA domain-containing protein [Anaerolineae bacterium]|nr:ASKHA domain-containing protein [Anaerolineae bacterium]